MPVARKAQKQVPHPTLRLLHMPPLWVVYAFRCRRRKEFVCRIQFRRNAWLCIHLGFRLGAPFACMQSKFQFSFSDQTSEWSSAADFQFTFG